MDDDGRHPERGSLGSIQASIVIVTKDDPRILDCLASALAQDPPFEFDVHVGGEWSSESVPDEIRARYGEDWDLHERLTRGGHPGRLVPEAILRHDHPDTVTELFAKEAWYKEGQVQMARKHGLSETWGVFQIPIAYAGLAGLFLGSILWRPLVVLGLGCWVLLALKHWIGARQEDDAVWWARPWFRLVEAAGGLAGVASSVTREWLPRNRAR